MPLRALILDVDGTLAETEEAHRAAFNATFARWGLGWHWSRDTYRELLRTTGGKERIRAFQGAEGPLGDAEIAALHAEKTRAYAGILARGDLSLRPGVADLIAGARRRGWRVAVATTTTRPNVEALCRCCWDSPADALFDVIVAGDEVAAKKPAPDVYDLALSRLALPPGDGLAFEDSRNGLLSARAAGLRVVVTPSAYTDAEDFREADHVFPDLAAAGLRDVLRPCRNARSTA
ncbi:HAD-IA family hydrolase [Roseovarius salinarum]|uniref:HAD-IA family hydrolase n=1 Tax=Roseovarius salinarum TaxID=1981892 RepID=UPI000C342CCE|nr:HAD-IA family hydrolase [Roseovarius salinarum]